MYRPVPVGRIGLGHTVGVTVVLVGPTAAGKSSLAAAIVRRYMAEGAEPRSSAPTRCLSTEAWTSVRPSRQRPIVRKSAITLLICQMSPKTQQWRVPAARTAGHRKLHSP